MIKGNEMSKRYSRMLTLYENTSNITGNQEW